MAMMAVCMDINECQRLPTLCRGLQREAVFVVVFVIVFVIVVVVVVVVVVTMVFFFIVHANTFCNALF